MKLTRFSKFAWGVLIFNLGVILWGAFVRASGSGAGCGSHWPLCNGEVIPRAPQIETMIELFHRTTSGISFLLVMGMFIWAFRRYPQGNIVRTGAALSMMFIITEALVGAGLVLFEWVAENASVGRAIAIAVHLVNTFLLLASISLTAWWSSGGGALRLKGRRPFQVMLAIGLGAMLVLGISGAVTALGDTLYPASSLGEGLQQDFSPTAHFLIRLRVFHPTIAILVSLYLILAAGRIRSMTADRTTALISRILVIFILLQVGAGFLNVYLLAPIWMQLVHLFLSDGVWISLVLLTASALSEGRVTSEHHVDDRATLRTGKPEAV
jgi:heme A synthase